MRPNIRVEIQNNLVEAMEVDENEDGEISDADDSSTPEKQSSGNQPVKIPFKNDKEKLQERAKRFSLAPDEIKNFTDDELNVLHSSLGIGASNEVNVRFEVIHLRGIDEMSAGDLLDYFLEFAPISVEWVDEECCNVVFLEKVSAARALHFMSKAVRGMPVRDDSSYFFNDGLQEETDHSVLLLNKNREIQLQDDEEIACNKLLNEGNSVDISEITSTIPPGYWRLGKKHPKSKCLLVRFSLKTDKQSLRTEQLSRYYKGQGKKLTQGIFGRNKDLFKPTKNPWSTLAKNWDEDAQFREKSPVYMAEEPPKLEIKNQSLKVRLGSKRKEEEVEPEEKPVKVKIPRMRMYADEEEEKIKRKKMLKRLSHQIKTIDDNATANSDLRTVLNLHNRTNAVKKEKPETEVFDLGATLKNRNKKMIFEIKSEERHRHHKRHKSRRHSSEEEDRGFRSDRYAVEKPKSKVAVVIKTQKKPTVASAVASTVWSRVGRSHTDSESESEESGVEESSQTEEEEEETGEVVERKRLTSRPGFMLQYKEANLKQTNFNKRPLKIEINNDHFRRK